MSDRHDSIGEMPPAGPEPDGWRSDPVYAPAAPPREAECAAFDLARIAEWLPKLGAVLWLERREWKPAPARASIGSRGVLLLDHPALTLLGRCSSASAHTQLTQHGPREWLCFRDAAGIVLAKLYLLPDTDYLAWDDMAAASRLEPAAAAPERWQPHAAFLRCALARLGTGWRARLLTFDLRRLPWLRTLGARPPLRISLLGLELARAIARAEGAELVSPLHAA
ncbi:MAG TPA: hypothetical protein VGC30_00590 [Dokdonella sp.]